MAERWGATIAETIPSDIRLLGLRDDEEGFRVLLQDKHSLFVYALHADAIFYRHYSDLSGVDITDSPAQTGKGAALIYRVHDSALIASLPLLDATVPLSHYALCFDNDDRIDIVCRGEAHVRGAHSRWSGADE